MFSESEDQDGMVILGGVQMPAKILNANDPSPAKRCIILYSKEAVKAGLVSLEVTVPSERCIINHSRTDSRLTTSSESSDGHGDSLDRSSDYTAPRIHTLFEGKKQKVSEDEDYNPFIDDRRPIPDKIHQFFGKKKGETPVILESSIHNLFQDFTKKEDKSKFNIYALFEDEADDSNKKKDNVKSRSKNILYENDVGGSEMLEFKPPVSSSFGEFYIYSAEDLQKAVYKGLCEWFESLQLVHLVIDYTGPFLFSGPDIATRFRDKLTYQHSRGELWHLTREVFDQIGIHSFTCADTCTADDYVVSLTLKSPYTCEIIWTNNDKEVVSAFGCKQTRIARWGLISIKDCADWVLVLHDTWKRKVYWGWRVNEKILKKMAKTPIPDANEAKNLWSELSALLKSSEKAEMERDYPLLERC